VNGWTHIGFHGSDEKHEEPIKQDSHLMNMLFLHHRPYKFSTVTTNQKKQNQQVISNRHKLWPWDIAMQQQHHHSSMLLPLYD
jgi:outer membrane lipoprotein-sorting protein